MFDSLPGPVQYWLGIIGSAVSYWLQKDAFIYSAALAFFTIFSIAPVMIVVVTLLGVVLGERTARNKLMSELEDVLGRQAAEVVDTAVANSQIDQSGLLPTLIGVLAIIVGATTVFAQMQKSLNAIWDVVPKPSKSSLWLFVRARILSLTMVLVIGFLLLVSLLLSVAIRAVMNYAEVWLPIPGVAMIGLEIVISLTVVTLLFAAIFRILPDVVLSWRDVMPAAFVTSLLFTLGRSLIAVYLANTATASAYGAAGALAMLLIWVNYSSLILLFGAALSRSHVEARGVKVEPRYTAVRVRWELLEDEK